MIPERAAGRILGAAPVDLAGQFGGLGPGGGIVDLVGLAVAEPGELAPVQHFVGAVLNDAADGVRKVLRGDAVHHHVGHRDLAFVRLARSEEHTSELQSLMRISYAVFCLKKKKETSATNKRDHKAPIQR